MRKKIWKWIQIAALIFLILAIGGFIYEKITHGRTVDLLDEHIVNLKRDNSELRGKLIEAEDEVAGLTESNTELESANTDLGERLSRSEEITGELRSENHRLKHAIESGTASAGEIKQHGLEAENAVTEAIEIVDRIQAEIKREREEQNQRD